MFFKKKKEKTKKEKEKTGKVVVIILDTNISMDCAKLKKLEFLEGLEAEADVFVPWAVCRELISSARMAEGDKKIIEAENFKNYMEWRDSFLKELTEQKQKMKTRDAERMVKAREARIEYAEPACSFVQEKVNSGKWKTIGTHNELKKYLNSFEERIKKMVDGRRADLEILACCFIATEQHPQKKVVLMTLDRRLRNAAEEFGIQTHKGSRDKSRLFKK